MNEWQPIETAPKDGSWILLAGGRTDESFHYEEVKNESRRPVVAKWCIEDECWDVAFWDGAWRTGYINPKKWASLESKDE